MVRRMGEGGRGHFKLASHSTKTNHSLPPESNPWNLRFYPVLHLFNRFASDLRNVVNWRNKHVQKYCTMMATSVGILYPPTSWPFSIFRMLPVAGGWRRNVSFITWIDKKKIYFIVLITSWRKEYTVERHCIGRAALWAIPIDSRTKVIQDFISLLRNEKLHMLQ